MELKEEIKAKRVVNGSFIFTPSQAEIIEAHVIKNIEAKLEKIRQKQEELKRDKAPKEAVEKLQKRLEGIENYWEDYLKEKIKG
jgi:vacuolar-type H+-ATPase subunit I/STV1